MKKILFRKILIDCLTFFLITLFSTGVIIWVFQAVNFLDIMIEDGRDYLVYINYSLLNFPKIIAKVLPFVFFFSFFYVITKYELNNELMIFWNFGVNKFQFVNFFFKFSLLIALIQIFLVSTIVPKAQDTARSFIRSSSVSTIDSFIKVKKFNDTIKGLTIYSDKKDKNGNLENIYLKKDDQITYAKKGRLVQINGIQILELYEGETIRVKKNKITNFKFSKSDFNFQNLETNTTTYIKTQEVSTIKLIRCYFKLQNSNFFNLNLDNIIIENCLLENLDNVNKELYKRLIVPFYLPVLMLILLFVILKSKETINYFKFKTIIFILGMATIISSEISLRFIKSDLLENLVIIVFPLMLTLFIYSIYFININSSNFKK